jgi:hypothetical protein
MKSYIDGLVGQQKLYSSAFFLLFVNSIVTIIQRKGNIKDPIFSTIPIIGIKPPDDWDISRMLLMFSVSISLWVSVSLLWWLYSFNEHHPKGCLEVDYLPGLLFMAGWIKILAGFVMAAMFWDDRAKSIGSQVIRIAGACIVIAPLVITIWIKEKFKH